MSDAIIWQSVRNILDTVRSLEALSDVVTASLMKEFQNSHIVDEGWDSCNDDGWIEPLNVQDFRLKSNKKSNARTLRWISVGYQLTSDKSEVEWKDGQRAKLLVGSSMGGFSFGLDFPNAGGEAEDNWDDGTAERYISDGFRWVGEYSGDWFFAVPLDSLKAKADVQRLVIKPLSMMIAGSTIQDAFGECKDFICLPPKHQELIEACNNGGEILT